MSLWVMVPVSAFPGPPSAQAPLSPSGILAEVTLSRDHRDQEDTIKKELETFSIKRIRLQFVRLGSPPQNIGIGGNVPADVARGVMHLAIKYNRGIQFLISESRYVRDYVAFGTSAFDEASQIPVSPEDLDRLLDPSLTTPEFHVLYQSLTRDDKSY